MVKTSVLKQLHLEAAAAVSSNILHSSPAYVQTLIGGVDDTGASIYSLDAAGGMIKDTFISTGSGSTFAYGVLEDRFHEDITVEEAKELALRAIKAATERDTYSNFTYYSIDSICNKLSKHLFYDTEAVYLIHKNIDVVD